MQTLSLDQLARTHKENDIYGKPLRGIYHYDLLNQIIGMCNAQNYDVEVTTSLQRRIKTAILRVSSSCRR